MLICNTNILILYLNGQAEQLRKEDMARFHIVTVERKVLFAERKVMFAEVVHALVVCCSQ